MTRGVALLAGAALALSGGLAAAAPPVPAVRAHCQKNTLGAAYCARDPKGVAVANAVGDIVCAPGLCVKAADGDWHCSFVSGGAASLDPAGNPVCEDGCRTPTATECEKYR